MFEIDPTRLDLAREFRRRPIGHHSPELQAVLDRMRGLPIEGKHCLIVLKPCAQWQLATMSGTPPRPVPVPGVVFNDLAEAEWTVFKLRWYMLTGHDLAAEFGEPAIPPPPADIAPFPDPSRGILAYVDEISVAPGDVLGVKVSCLGITEYRARIVRLRAPESGPAGIGYRDEPIAAGVDGQYRGRVQTLHLGSYAILPPVTMMPESFTAQVLAWPTRLAAGEQALVGDWSAALRRGFALFLDDRGALALRFGDGERVATFSTGVRLPERRWVLLAASFDASSGTVALHQIPIGARGFGPSGAAETRHRTALRPAPGAAPLLFAAWHQAADATGAHFNGKLEAPRLACGALGKADMLRLAGVPVPPDLGAALVGAWDFSRDVSSERITDLSDNALHGRIVNLPARAMTGHNWTGAEMNWMRAPEQYGAIHFHDDDLGDAGWENDFTWTVPPDLKSGVYAVRLSADGVETDVPFFVTPPRGCATARIAYLASTATYTAYANNKARFVGAGTELLRGHLLDFDPADLMLLHHGLGLSTYCVHSDGSGVCYGTRLRPMTNFRPKGRLWNFASDLFVVDWLEHVGCGYDVITDDDLHRDGAALLARYAVVVTGTHPEYYTREMREGMDAYLKRGGRLMYLGGNGFYWRIAYHPEKSGIVELRRAEGGTRAWAAAPGEYYMGFNGEYGGLWSRQGRAPNALAGVGFVAQGFDASSPYRRKPASRDPRVAFIFDGIDDEILGNFGHLGGGAAGDELDAFDVLAGSPPHALVLASSDHHTNAYQLAHDAVLVPNGATNGLLNPLIRADMTFFECPNGGAVFSTGSIAYAGSLSHDGYDNNVARLTGNVMQRFLDPAPFLLPYAEIVSQDV